MLVRPTQPFCVEWGGYTQTFNPERLFEDNHPLVAMYPTLFEPATPRDVDRVEETRAEPGTKRNR